MRSFLFRAFAFGLGFGLLVSGWGCFNITPLAQCFGNQDCASGSSCQSGICVKPTLPTQCPASCQIDADCRVPRCSSMALCVSQKCYTSARWVTDTKKIPESQAVDILFVIDNSGSMKEEQEKLSRTFSSFITELASREVGNYQIGVISTDMDDPLQRGKLQGTTRIINRGKLSAANVIATFQQNVLLGVKGTSYEKPLDAMLAALSPQLLFDANANKGFLRPGAILSVVFVTDEDDCSHNGTIPESELDSEVCRLPSTQILTDEQGNPIPDPKGKPIKGKLEQLTPVSAYIDFLKSLNRPVVLMGLIGPTTAPKSSTDPTPIDPSGGCSKHVECNNQQLSGRKCIYSSPTTKKCGGCTSLDANAVPGFRIGEVIQAFEGGQMFPICGGEAEFGDALVKHAESIASILNGIVLSQTPLSQDHIKVELHFPDNRSPLLVPKASPTNPAQPCKIQRDCGTPNNLCGPDQQCYSNGWLLSPKDGKYHLQLSGSARSNASPGSTLSVTYISQ